MIFQMSYLQSGNNPVALAEWFIVSVAIVIVVTLIYVFILNKSPPPEGITQAKIESTNVSIDTSSLISSAQDILKSGDTRKSVELAVTAAGNTLSTLLKSTGVDLSNMNISDMAYLVQSKATGSSDITQPIYQLNLLHLKSAQSQPIALQEAEWAINTANWLSQLVATQQIKI